MTNPKAYYTLEELRTRRGYTKEDRAEIAAQTKALEQEQLAYNLAELRRLCDVTQVQLADRLGKTQPAISRLEKAEDNKLSTIRQMVEALGADLEVFAVKDGQRIPLA